MPDNKPVRLPLVVVPENRGEYGDRDAKLINGFLEPTNQESYHVYKRPGLKTYLRADEHNSDSCNFGLFETQDGYVLVTDTVRNSIAPISYMAFVIFNKGLRYESTVKTTYPSMGMTQPFVSGDGLFTLAYNDDTMSRMGLVRFDLVTKEVSFPWSVPSNAYGTSAVSADGQRFLLSLGSPRSVSPNVQGAYTTLTYLVNTQSYYTSSRLMPAAYTWLTLEYRRVSAPSGKYLLDTAFFRTQRKAVALSDTIPDAMYIVDLESLTIEQTLNNVTGYRRMSRYGNEIGLGIGVPTATVTGPHYKIYPNLLQYPANFTTVTTPSNSLYDSLGTYGKLEITGTTVYAAVNGAGAVSWYETGGEFVPVDAGWLLEMVGEPGGRTLTRRSGTSRAWLAHRQYNSRFRVQISAITGSLINVDEMLSSNQFPPNDSHMKVCLCEDTSRNILWASLKKTTVPGFNLNYMDLQSTTPAWIPVDTSTVLGTGTTIYQMAYNDDLDAMVFIGNVTGRLAYPKVAVIAVTDLMNGLPYTPITLVELSETYYNLGNMPQFIGGLSYSNHLFVKSGSNAIDRFSFGMPRATMLQTNRTKTVAERSGFAGKDMLYTYGSYYIVVPSTLTNEYEIFRYPFSGGTSTIVDYKTALAALGDAYIGGRPTHLVELGGRVVVWGTGPGESPTVSWMGVINEDTDTLEHVVTGVGWLWDGDKPAWRPQDNTVYFVAHPGLGAGGIGLPTIRGYSLSTFNITLTQYVPAEYGIEADKQDEPYYVVSVHSNGDVYLNIKKTTFINGQFEESVYVEVPIQF